MKLNLFYIVLLWSVSSLFAQDAELLFKEANENYSKGTFEEALVQYHKIDSLGVYSADLYYNMGNTYYKLNQVAPAIYYFEKALLLEPGHNDAQYNLTFANRMRIDEFDVLPKTILQKINERLIYQTHYNTWAWISVLFVLLSVLFFFLYYFTAYTSKKRLFFTLTLISLLLTLLLFSFTFKAKHHNAHNRYAIVFDSVVSVKAEPNLAATEVFQLHEGTKVKILETFDQWQKIKIPDGKIGWMLSETTKELKD